MLPKYRNPSHPGEILRDLYMEPLGLTQTRLARHLGCTRAALNELIHGRRGVSPQMALRLADVFKTTPQLWLNLQMDYDLWKAQQQHKSLPAIA